ncbi:hypothetical protein SAICODRAFT_29857 [Saitoella complicata NRRL Y-17804]|uniref:uncharacterized protein n=1 Tax=Saitoella complicata (strain BCRC 22490 / CBS 7301 / JCM 7358 / NBRC 10748 / NRRL Y-17804) TaxID=698492 RepID=UPI00086810E4|nr:uncharacterized protein SAICODRAFT_29857 [Saitoella complicata NRRL Y-17804]ODQ53893.1 hypothetical protein SAICODRAFT_29857 [Saitoella complicata NRRL Y-17804]
MREFDTAGYAAVVLCYFVHCALARICADVVAQCCGLVVAGCVSVTVDWAVWVGLGESGSYGVWAVTVDAAQWGQYRAGESDGSGIGWPRDGFLRTRSTGLPTTTRSAERF